MNLKKMFDTELERREFKRLFTFQEYNNWRKQTGAAPTLKSLKDFKDVIFNLVLESVWDIDYLRAEEEFDV